MAKKKIYADVLKELWAKHKGEKSYDDVRQMTKDVILKQEEIARLASGKRVARAKAKQEEIDKKHASGGQSFNRSFSPKGEYS